MMFKVLKELPKKGKITGTRICRRFSLRNIPYNFKGVENKKSTYESTSSARHFINQFFGEDVETGFKLAYEGYLEALVEDDMDYIKEICEPSMADKIRRNMASLDLGNNYLIQKPVDNKTYELSFAGMKFSLGADFDRRNKTTTKPQRIVLNEFEMELFLDQSNPMSMMRYMSSSGGIKMPRIFQVVVEINTNVGLQVVPHDYSLTSKDIVENERPYLHRVLFEVPVMNEINLQSSGAMFGQIMGKGMLPGRGGGAQEMFRAIFNDNEFDWYISDFDNLMMGNKLGE